MMVLQKSLIELKPFATSVQTSQREMSKMVRDELGKIDKVEGKEGIETNCGSHEG